MEFLNGILVEVTRHKHESSQTQVFVSFSTHKASNPIEELANIILQIFLSLICKIF
jgi:hypothetical protein